MKMLLINDLKDIQKKTEYLLKLATKLTQQSHCANTAYDQHVFSTVSKELYRFIKNRMEPEPDVIGHREKIRA